MGGGARVTICSCSEDRCNYGLVEEEHYEEAGVTHMIWAVLGLVI